MSAEQSPSPLPRYSPGDYALALNRDTKELRRYVAADREALERCVGALDLHEIGRTIDEHERGAETLIQDWFDAAYDGRVFPLSADSAGAAECFTDPLTRVYDKLRAFYPEGTENREYPAYRLQLALGAYLTRWGRCLPFCLEKQLWPDDDFGPFVCALAPAAKPGKRRRAKRRRTASVRPLTERQREAMELYGTYNGKIDLIANKMGISRATVSQHLDAAWRKLPQFAPKKTSPSGRTRRLPTDRRGQVDVPDNRGDGE